VIRVSWGTTVRVDREGIYNKGLVSFIVGLHTHTQKKSFTPADFVPVATKEGEVSFIYAYYPFPLTF
jgi:hypothetical protein